eukprot:TRINITY_DN2967_c0_g1_i1.p1 TRINITY_DN2967_c0_g1~~TRINITY_DN2967_c0_g1_i1.p1  ORF type:complete len:357 (-),score=76.55 TRINITY_DN2967_c0_g1_i1:40-1110(-)
MHRSDYMIHSSSPSSSVSNATDVFQVELNTIASSFGCLSGVTSKLHRFLVERGYVTKESGSFPEFTDPGVGLAEGLASAHKLYSNPNALVMMVVLPGENNISDQRMLEYKLWEHHKIGLIRKTLSDLADRGKLDHSTNAFQIDGHEVSVAYFRAGYDPTHYPSQKEWDGRLLLERSKAVKCPSIAYHLTGTKKIQQVLFDKSKLESIVGKEIADQLRVCFTGLYGLDGDDVDRVKEMVLLNPSNFVMKPQREGGGHLLHGNSMVEYLKTMDKKELADYIVMSRIVPPPHDTLMLRDGQVHKFKGISELGTYGVFLFDGKNIILNKAAGTLLRTKPADSEDGGVYSGIASLDSPFLV